MTKPVPEQAFPGDHTCDTVPCRFPCYVGVVGFRKNETHACRWTKGVANKLTAMRKPLSNLSVTWTLLAWLTGTV